MEQKPLNKFEMFKKAWEDYPSQDNEGYRPDRGGFKCGWYAAWDLLEQRTALAESDTSIKHKYRADVLENNLGALSKKHIELLATLLAINEFWFQPGPDSGVCALCDGGQDPHFLDKHEPDCVIQLTHDTLIKQGVLSGE
jgi:hypothetical protein